MLYGNAIHIIKRYYIANNRGFISAYALVMFMIILNLLTMYVWHLRTYTELRKNEEVHVYEVLTIHHVCEHFRKIKLAASDEEQSENNITEETLDYNNTQIKILYQKEQANVTFMVHKHVYEMKFDFMDGHLHDIRYS